MIESAASKSLVTVALMLTACSSAPTGDASSTYFIGTLSAEQIARICTFDSSCGVENIQEGSGIAGSGIAECITALTAILPGHAAHPGIPAASVRCGLSATSCADYETCAGGGYSVGYCSVHARGSCDGEVAVSCRFGGGPSLFASDCGAQGLTCVVETDSSGTTSFCSAGACTPGTSAMPHCVGTVSQYFCTSAGHQGAQDCAQLAPGWICEEGRGCVDGTLPSCVGSGYQCQGTHLVTCLDGRAHDDDCATTTTGGTCMLASDASSAVCVAGASAACDPFADAANTCSGTSVQSCAGGQRVTIDCTAYGFAGCADGRCTE